MAVFLPMIIFQIFPSYFSLGAIGRGDRWQIFSIFFFLESFLKIIPSGLLAEEILVEKGGSCLWIISSGLFAEDIGVETREG